MVRKSPDYFWNGIFNVVLFLGAAIFNDVKQAKSNVDDVISVDVVTHRQEVNCTSCAYIF